MSVLIDIDSLRFNQKRLMAITRGTRQTISVAEAAIILKMPTQAVAKLMARWAEAGSLARIKRGVYLTESAIFSDVDSLPMEPWVIAEDLYRPCYIGGLTAAVHWGLLDNTFQENMVFTTQKPRSRRQSISGIKFLLRSISHEAMYGLISAWKGQCKVQVSDPSRTMIDFLMDPRLAGGIYSAIDMFITYLHSEHKNIELLYKYAKRLQSGAVLKRLGFMLERYEPSERGTIALCKMLMSTGTVKLDPQLSAKKLITRWGLWVPNGI